MSKKLLGAITLTELMLKEERDFNKLDVLGKLFSSEYLKRNERRKEELKVLVSSLALDEYYAYNKKKTILDANSKIAELTEQCNELNDKRMEAQEKVAILTRKIDGKLDTINSLQEVIKDAEK